MVASLLTIVLQYYVKGSMDAPRPSQQISTSTESLRMAQAEACEGKILHQGSVAHCILNTKGGVNTGDKILQSHISEYCSKSWK